MAELKSPGEVANDMRKFFEAVPGPVDVIHKLGFKTIDEIVPTPAQVAEREHQERLMFLEKQKVREVSLAELMRTFAPPGPKLDFSLLDFA